MPRRIVALHTFLENKGNHNELISFNVSRERATYRKLYSATSNFCTEANSTDMFYFFQINSL